jgi:hypothetical protein
MNFEAGDAIGEDHVIQPDQQYHVGPGNLSRINPGDFSLITITREWYRISVTRLEKF